MTISVVLGVQEKTTSNKSTLVINGTKVFIYKDGKVIEDPIVKNGKAVIDGLCEGKYVIVYKHEKYEEKEMAVALMDSVFFIERNEKVNSEIQAIINRFEQTKLTEEESKVFDNLKNNIEGLKRSEKTLIKSRFKIKADLLKGLSNTKENLHDLSKIQLVSILKLKHLKYVFV